MSWPPTIYVQFQDEPTARAMAAALGVEFPNDGSVPTGNRNYALAAPILPPWITPPTYDEEGELVTPGVAEDGYWAMLRLNMDWPGFAETMAALEEAGVIRDVAEPRNVFA